MEKKYELNGPRLICALLAGPKNSDHDGRYFRNKRARFMEEIEKNRSSGRLTRPRIPSAVMTS